MLKRKNCGELEQLSDRNLPFLFLLIAGGIEFLFITMESLFSYIGYYLAEDYIIVPCLLFLGVVLTKELTQSAKRRLLLSAAVVAWFVIVQIQHKLSGMGTHPIGTFFFIYLMAFPFAAATEDKKSKGLTIIGKCFVAASLVLVLYAVMLLLDCVPAALEPFVFWDGTRLHVFWHSNINACIFMIGIGFSAYFWFQTENRVRKVFLAVSVVLQFLAMALTNCRTSLLLVSALFGGIAFFAICKGSWKRVVVALIAALVLMVGSFWASSTLYALRNEMRIAKITAQLQSDDDLDDIEEDFYVQPDTGEVIIISDNGQGALSDDMRTLNGRTGIWKAALSAVRDNKSLALWGTEYVGIAISAYNSFEVVHAHNSWIEALMRLGLPGLLAALLFTCIAVRSAVVLLWSKKADMGKKIIAMLAMCVMVAGFLEPYLFITNVYYHFIDFIFFLCVGYLDYWREQLSVGEIAEV